MPLPVTNNLPPLSMPPPNMPHGGYNPLSSPLKRPNNLINLPEHKPISGTIFNPDYSYNPK